MDVLSIQRREINGQKSQRYSKNEPVHGSLKKTDALAPFTVLSEIRDHLQYDSFGQLLGSVNSTNLVHERSSEF